MTQRTSTLLVAAALLLAGAATLAGESVGREVTVSALDNEKFLPAVAYNGAHEEFLVVWHNYWGSLRDVYGTRLDRFGKVIETFTIAAGANDRAQAAVAYDSARDRYLVVWIYDYYGDSSDWDVRGRLVPWDGPDPALAEFPIYQTVDSQWNPKVAYSTGDDEFLVVWTNTAAGIPATVSMRYVLPDGTPDYAGTVAGDETHNFANGDLTYSQLRDEYLIVYDIDGADIAARRVDNTGLLDTEVTVADWPDAESAPSVAACPGQDQWLVAWQNSAPKIYARFLTGAGAVDGAPLEIFDAAAGQQRAPALACLPGAGHYLVAWEQEYSGSVFGIWGRRIGTNKAFLAPGFTVRPVYSPQLRHAKTPALAGGTLGWSVSWVQEREGSAYSDLHARMVWMLFADDFETGNTSTWSAVSP